MRNNTRGFTLVEILIVVGIVSALAAISVPNLLRARISTNEATAQATLKTISNALENYGAINDLYPTSTAQLAGPNPPYLNVDYFNGEHSGYTFAAALTAYTYTITATPGSATKGVNTFQLITGGVISQL